MLTLQTDTIKDEPISLEGEVAATELPGLAELITGRQLEVNGPVRYAFNIFRVSGMIEIRGNVAASLALACSRCLDLFDHPVEASFELTYADELPQIEDESGEEIELTADEMGIALLEDEELDLAEPLVEQLLLDLPFRPVCKESCKGLCPQCGADLNETQCSCGEEQFDTRFAALKNLKIDSDK